MVVFPNAKINIGLYVTGKRPDGYHDLCSVFFPVKLCDALEIITMPGNQDKPVTFTTSGLSVPGGESDNLCFRAYQLLRNDHPGIPDIRLHLHKVIPMGAGMGGGSSNGAFTIRLLNDKFKLGLSEDQMKGYALQLGSDCPFFISNRPSRVTGRGEHIEPFELDLSRYELLIVNPGIHIPTGWAFRHLELKNRTISLFDDILLPVEAWKDCISNDFEKPVMAAHPAISLLKAQLYEAGAVYASMSGSGSTVFGLFPHGTRPALLFPETYFQKWV